MPDKQAAKFRIKAENYQLAVNDIECQLNSILTEK